MKVAISANGKSLESTIHERFGRCPYFLIVETDDMSVEVIENSNAELSTSAGIQSAGLVASKGVAAVITGNCGPRAIQVFDAAAIAVVSGQHGPIKNAVDAFKRGAIGPAVETGAPPVSMAGQPTDPVEPGRPGMGSGRGCGRGLGGGRGMGRRCVAPSAAGRSDIRSTPVQLPREAELTRLRQQADDLKRRMDAIQSKIKELA